MKISFRKGLGFGLTSGIITTLGLIVGLNSGTHSKITIIGGILVIAVADAMSDALGIHVSEESENQHSAKEIWESTISTFLSKFIIALTFIIPVLLLPLSTAIVVCVAWGLGLVIIFNYYIAKTQNIKPFKIITEHLLIAIVVIIITQLVGKWVATLS